MPAVAVAESALWTVAANAGITKAISAAGPVAMISDFTKFFMVSFGLGDIIFAAFHSVA